MRFTDRSAEYDVVELIYDDPVNNSHKFYTVYMDLKKNQWWAHYGRIGTAGTKTATKPKTANGVKKAYEKYQKGYEIIRQGRMLAIAEVPSGGVPRGQIIDREIL